MYPLYWVPHIPVTYICAVHLTHDPQSLYLVLSGLDPWQLKFYGTIFCHHVASITLFVRMTVTSLTEKSLLL